ncbi:hypothetical protein 23F_00028 [Ralstonia phage Gerry]|uniref:Helicase C-terminal domain-containing protein n=1 Tax=Ralstonia phage Gerry TaxID=2759727 RepID=A0A7G5BA67_9CAUD|nr:DarB-like antirestriction [Ralstonia phage Gerry]QMV33190.1 hypothetical protein 23F_00028 [Ralstonia phage Gerry]
MADNQPFFAPLFDTTEDTNASIYQLPPLQEALKSEPDAAPAVKSRGMPTASDVSRRAEELGIDPKFALSIFKQESSGNFNERDSNKGAIGGMQVMPGTYKAMMGTTEGMRDPWNNLEAGLRYIAYGQRALGTKDPALLAAGYHAGYDRKDLKQGIIPDVSDGAKRTRDYAREVAARAGGSAPAGKVASADSAAPATPSIPSLQSALDAQEPGRYEVLADPGADVLTRLNTGDDKDRYELASPDEISRFEAGKKESVGDAAKSFLGKSLKAGMYDLAGAGAKLLDAVNPWTLSESDAATLFKSDPAKLKDYQDNSVAMILSRFARRMSHNSEDAMKEISPGAELRYGHKEYATTDLDKAAYASPVKVIGDVVRNLPTQVGLAISAYLTRGAAAQAESQALKAGLTAEAAKQAAIQAGAKTMATIGAVSEGAIGYAQQANQAREDAEKVKQADLEKSPEYQKLLANGYTPETAKQKLAAVTAEQAGVVAGVVDAAVNKVGGHFLGKIMTEGGKFVPRVMKGFVNEGATEAIQSPGEQYAQNSAVKRNINPNQDLSEGVLENAVQGLVVGGVSGGGFAGAMGRGHSSAAPNNAAPAVPAAPAAPENQAPAAPAAPVAAAPAAPVAEPAAPAGPIERAVGKVVPESKQVVGDDGTVYNVKVGDNGVEVAPIEPVAEAAPALTEREKALQEIGDNAASEKPPKPEPAAKVEEAASARVEEPAAKAPAGPTDTRAPAGADLSAMDEPALRERMKYLAGQAKRTGGWDKMLVAERKRVEAEISKRKNGQPAAQVEQAAEPAPEKTASGAFVKQADANDAMRTAARETGKPHQVVEREEAGRVVFDVRPMEEANGANARRAEPAGAPVTAAEQASAAPAAPAAERPARAAKTAPTAGEPGAAAGEATAEPAALTVKAASGKVYPTKGERLPKAGVVPANLGNDGIVYVGRPNSLHFHVADRHSKAAGGFSDTGFVTPDGQYLNREEALAWVNTHEAKVKPSENMGASLDAIDYREQVPESKRKAPEAAEDTAAKPAAAPAEAVKWFGTREQAKEANGDRSVIVSNDGHIIDGHHQALAAKEEGKDVKAIVLDAPVDQALEAVKNSPSAQPAAEPAPAAPKKPSTKAEPNRVHRVLGDARKGDTVTPSADIGYSKAGQSYEIEAIGRNGETTVRNTATGGRTTWSRAELERAARMGVTIEKQQPAGAEAKGASAGKASGGVDFSKNRLFTEDAVEKARARMRRKLKSTAFTGLDPELVTDGMTIAGAYIEAGVREFGAYAKAMVEDFGAEVKPYLLSFYEAVRHFPGLETEGMTAPQEAGRLHAELLSQNETAQEAQHDTEANPARPGAGDEGQSAAAVRGDEGGRDAVRVSESADGGRAGVAERGAQHAGERPAVPEDQRPANADAGSEQSAEGSRERGATAGSRGDQQPASAAANHRIRPGDLKREGSWKDTAERNVEIVELVKQLEKGGRVATPDERALLARYTGWGASEIANGIFPDRNGRYKDASWQALGERLKAALTPAEYADARRTMQYAHYTSEGVIRAIYAGLDRLGFKGGAILEPGMGVGHFNGLMPSQMAAHSSYTGIEFDPITGAIARALYPQSNVIVGDYTKTALPKDFFDAAIGNPPFSSTVVSNDAEYKKHGFMLHDYFFAKTLDRVKPGGVVAFVTSKGTMDKASSRAREFMAERANLIGAVRLPQTAFKENAGTEVVTDVLFLQKRGPGIPDNGVKWLGTKEVDTPQGKAPVNEYFSDHPEMVLGEHAKTGSMYRADEYTVVPRAGEDIEQAFAKAIQSLPEGDYRPARGSAAERAFVQDRDFNPKAKKEGGLYVADDGRLMQVEDGAGADLTHRLNSEGKRIELKPKERAWLRGWVSLRDALKQAQLDQLTDGDWQGSLQALNGAYDAFVKEHGNILAFSTIERENPDGTTSVTRRLKNAPLMTIDAEGALAHALERINEDGTISKGAVLQDRVLKRPTEPVINTTQDAMFVALDRHGAFDVDTVARLAGVSREQAIADLGTAIYEAPGASWQMADEYLSGNVVRKLKEAQAATEIDKRYSRNVEALLAVQPRPLGPQDISVKLGANWVKPADIEAFARDALGERMDVAYHEKLNDWTVASVERAITEWGFEKMSASQILDATLNNRQIKVTFRDQDGKTHVDIEATTKANDISQKMKDAFRRWIWTDAERADRLTRYYNENFNNIAPRAFDGSHLTLPGMSSRYALYDHQKRAVWRQIQAGDTYLAHAVGAGKTMEMIAGGMEQKRLGLIDKPVYAVPNHMLAQFAREFMELYPAANIMVADETNFHTHNRRRFIAQAALNNPDAIVMTHSSFGRVGMSEEFTKSYIEKQIGEWKEILAETDKGDRLTRKQVERRIEQLERRIEAKQATEKKDRVLTFEELGADMLFVDELHEFRKLDFATNQGNVKGIDPSGSQRAFDLMMKVEYLRGKKPGRSLVGASGTPVTNTMGELYTAQRLFQPKQLEEDGLTSFDAWANQYGDIVAGFEQNAAGGYEVVARFAKFQNVPELMRRVRSFMDILTSSNLGELVKRPTVEGGQREVRITPAPDGYKEYQQELQQRITAIRQRKGPPKKGEDIILRVIGDGRFSAIDMRFVDPSRANDPDSKLNQMLDALIDDYHAMADNEYSDTATSKPDPIKGASHIIFTDIGLGEQSAASRGFDMRRWIEKRLTDGGVPADHIAFMRDYKLHAKKERLFADMREGKKRILIGGKDMETGVNVQKRLATLDHLDAPWFPASVEQREGRPVRQGNQNKQVRLRAWATKGSYDSTMWGMNARKARFIEQAMNGDDTVRSLEDVSEASAFEMAAALASGDERYMKLAGLKQDVDRLERLRHAHFDEQRRLSVEKQYAVDAVDRNERRVADLTEAIKQRTPIRAGEFLAQAGKAEFDAREQFSAALFDEFKALTGKEFNGEQVIGRIGGFPITFYGLKGQGSDAYVAGVHVGIPGDPDPIITYPIRGEFAINGIAARAANQVNSLDRMVVEAKDRIEQSQRKIEQIESRLGTPFPEEGELLEKVVALNQLENELTAEKAAEGGEQVSADAAAATVETEGGEDGPRYSVAPGVDREQSVPVTRIQTFRNVRGTTVELSMTLRDGNVGDLIGRLLDRGRVVLHDDAGSLPGKNAPRGVQASTMPDGTIHMVGANLNAQSAVPVLLHEMFHSGVKPLVGEAAWGKLMTRLDGLLRQSERSTGRAREFYDAAFRRMRAAAHAGDARVMNAEEFGAYAIEEYSSAPAAVRAWVDDVVGAIKAWLLRRFGTQLGAVTPAQLRALAVAALRSEPRAGGDAPRNSVKAPLNPVEAGLTPPAPTRFDRFQAAVQDNMNRVKQVQERIKKLTGLKELGFADYYRAEANRPGRVAARLEDAQKHLTGPLMERLAKSGHTQAQLEELLHAQHAEERNEKIAEINKDMPDGGSGMMTAEANAILEKYKGATELKAIAQQARDIARATLDLKLAYGLIDQTTHDTLSTGYENYVPLKGDGEYGPKIKRAMGHEERAEHILENIARDYDQAVAAGEKNIARQSLLALVAEHEDPSLWTIGIPPRGRRIAGQVFNVVDPSLPKGQQTIGSFSARSQVDAFLEGAGPKAASYLVLDSGGERVQQFVRPLQDNEVMVYVKGEPVRIQIYDEALARQLRPLDPPKMNWALEKMRSLNRYLSKIYTGYNPSFILRNAARDALTGTINMVGHEGAGVAAKAWAKYPGAVKALGQWAATGNAPVGKTGEYLKEYRMHGGKTGASWMSDLEAKGKELSRMYEDAYGASGYLKDGQNLKAAKVAGRKIVGGMAHVVEIANQATENALRLSLYMTLRESGASPGKAAQAAKSVTVDFDRKGTMTGALGAVYLFLNPAVQGTANAMRTLASGEHRGQAFAALGMLATLGFYAAASGMDDDKDRWLGEGWDGRTKNFVMMFGDHTLKVPLSQEFTPAYAFGVALAEAMRGEGAMKSAVRMVSSFLDAYFPLNGAYNPDSDNHAEDALLAAMPTIIKPGAESVFNRNHFGSQIVPETTSTKSQPDNLKMYRGTKGTVYDALAQQIAAAGELAGAGRYQNDITKISPETLKYVWRTYTGGLGQFVTDSIGAASLATEPGEMSSSDIPIAKDFWRAQDVKPIRSRYYDLAREAKEAATEFQQAKKAGDGEAIDSIFARPGQAELIALDKMFKKSSHAAAAIRDEEVTVNADKSLSTSEKRDRLKELEKQEESIYRDALDVFKTSIPSK